MARARILVLSSPRLARLDRLLIAAGAPRGHVERADDALELFDVEAARGARLIADLESVPLADAGILRRWQEEAQGSRILWVGGHDSNRDRFEAAGARGTRIPWPLDVEVLQRLADGHPPTEEPGDRPAQPGSPPAQTPPAEDLEDRELHEIESILHPGTPGPQGRDRSDQAGADAQVMAAPVSAPPAAPAADQHATPPVPRLETRSAFLRAPNSQVERPIPVSASTLRGAPEQRLEQRHDSANPEPQELRPLDASEDEFEATSADLLPSEVPMGSAQIDEPLLTDEEIEAFFSEAEDFVIPAMDPAGRETPLIDPLTAPPHDGEGAAPPDEGEGAAHHPSAEQERPAEDSVQAVDDGAAAAEVRRPAWLKDQIADLADIVQALDLTARANDAHLSMERELGQLRQFTRTIGFVAAPPPRGEQDFDLGVLVEEQLGGLAGQAPDSPRILFKSRAERPLIRADKLLVTMALEALLLTAIGCAGPGDVIRVLIDQPGGDAPCVHIRFPSGPMADLAPADALQPYALKGRLPGIGANALAAAGAIAVGQGGDLVLREEDAGFRMFDVSFSNSLDG